MSTSPTSSSTSSGSAGQAAHPPDAERRGDQGLRARGSRPSSEWSSPDLMVCLGATAVRAVIGSKVRVMKDHGELMESRLGRTAMPTLHSFRHPSSGPGGPRRCDGPPGRRSANRAQPPGSLIRSRHERRDAETASRRAPRLPRALRRRPPADPPLAPPGAARWRGRRWASACSDGAAEPRACSTSSSRAPRPTGSTAAPMAQGVGARIADLRTAITDRGGDTGPGRALRRSRRRARDDAAAPTRRAGALAAGPRPGRVLRGVGRPLRVRSGRGPRGRRGARRRSRPDVAAPSTTRSSTAPPTGWAGCSAPSARRSTEIAGARQRRDAALGELRPALERGRGLGVQPARDPPGLAGRPAGLDRRAHRASPSPPDPPPARPSSRAARRRSPSSIASAASEAVPIPASRMTGTPARSTMIRRL